MAALNAHTTRTDGPSLASQAAGGPATATGSGSAGTPLALLRQSLLIATTIATGLMAGFFYTYHVSVTRGLAIVDDATYVEAMNAINATIRNAQFGVAFFGSAVLGVLALSAYLRSPRTRVTAFVGTATVLYFVTLAITGGVSIPLNNQLAADAAAAGADLAQVRAAYETAWNSGNAARTLTNLGSFVLLTAALITSDTAGRNRR